MNNTACSPCIFRFFSNMTRSIETYHDGRRVEAWEIVDKASPCTNDPNLKDGIQFHAGYAPVPLSTQYEHGMNLTKIYIHVLVKTSFAEQKPYVLETPIGSNMMVRTKSNIMKTVDNRRKREYKRGGR